MRGTVLVVDDLVRPRRALCSELEDAGFDVVQAADGAEAWALFEAQPPSVVVTDLVMPKADGLDLLGRIRAKSDVPVIMFTAKGSVASAASAFKSGADEFVSSNDLEIEELVALVTRAGDAESEDTDHDAISQQLVGSSLAIQRLRERLLGLAGLRAPVLVLGEPGSGRDLAVRLMHERGASGEGPLLKIDATSRISQDELRACRAVYLDEIETLSAETQAMWARWLRDGFQHGIERWPRVFASTSSVVALPTSEPGPYAELRNLLLRFTVELPSLRSIPHDIGPIADSIVARFCAALEKRTKLSPSARNLLIEQRWPANGRQLGLLLERAVAFARTRTIRREALAELLAELDESIDGIRAQHRAMERQQLLDAIRETGGNVSRTAEKLGRSRSAVYRMIERYDITLNRAH